MFTQQKNILTTATNYTLTQLDYSYIRRLITSYGYVTSLSSFTTSDLAEGSNLYYTDERVDDRAATLIQNGTGITWSYNDGSNTLTPTISLASFSTTNLSEGSNLYFTDERAQDAVGGILSAEFTYNDGSNTISINSISYTKISGLGTLATQNGTFSGTSSGTNTGDQNLFSTIIISGQSNVVADSTSDSLTLVAGTGITLTTDATNDIITISSSSSGISMANVFAVSSLRI